MDAFQIDAAGPIPYSPYRQSVYLEKKIPFLVKFHTMFYIILTVISLQQYVRLKVMKGENRHCLHERFMKSTYLASSKTKEC